MRPTALFALLLAIACPRLPAAVLTVGPDGQYPDLQAALDVAVANGEDDNIRIQAGTLLTLGASAIHAEDRYLEISGGWISDFSSGLTDPTATRLSGNGVAPMLGLTVSQGEVVLRYVSFADGVAPLGGAANIAVEGSARFGLSHCEFRDNRAEGALQGRGGGLLLTVSGSAEAELLDCHFEGNAVAGSDASGGGLFVQATDGLVRAQRLRFIGNQAIGSSTASAGGLGVDLGALDANLELRELQVRGNLVDAPGESLGAGLKVSADGVSQQLLIEGAEVFGNARTNGTGTAGQLQLRLHSGTARLRSLALVDGVDAGGLVAVATGSAQLLATNLTAAANADDGIRLDADSPVTQVLENSLAWGNDGGNIEFANAGSGGVSSFFNLTGVDPGVVDAAVDDYRLAPGSPEIDGGWPQPVAGLGSIDALGAARVVNGAVDRGAYEYVPERIFGSGFEAD